MPLYTNLDGTTPDKSIADILKWQVVDRLRGRRPPDPVAFEMPRRANDGKALAAPTAHATWIGHATFVFRLGGKLVATDPIWSPNIHGTAPRRAAPGVALEDLPPLDVVTVSHSHFDHLDLATLKRIGPEPVYVVPKDVGKILAPVGARRVVELAWWETHVEGDLRITLVPAQHWSMRMPWDRNRTLWGGFVYQGPEGVAYHAGDTAFDANVFETIRRKVPPIDWAMLPIGAYDPTWFMKAQHMGPEEAVRVAQILEARNMLAMHWGTYKLTDEPLGEPPVRARAAWRAAGFPEERLWVLDVGETRALERRAAR